MGAHHELQEIQGGFLSMSQLLRPQTLGDSFPRKATGCPRGVNNLFPYSLVHVPGATQNPDAPTVSLQEFNS